MVIVEKNPNTRTEITEKANANMFLNLTCRTTDIIDTIVTANKISPSTIIIASFILPTYCWYRFYICIIM